MHELDSVVRLTRVRGLRRMAARLPPGTLVDARSAISLTLAKEDPMDHASTIKRMYQLISAGDIDGFGELVADDFVEHEQTPGLEATKEGIKQLFRLYRGAFPDLRMEAQDVLVSGDKVVARVRA